MIVAGSPASAQVYTKTFTGEYVCDVVVGGLTITDVPVNITASADIPALQEGVQLPPIKTDISLDLAYEDLRSSSYTLLKGRFTSKTSSPSDNVELGARIRTASDPLDISLPVENLSSPKTAIPSSPLSSGNKWVVPATGQAVIPIPVPKGATTVDVYMPSSMTFSATLIKSDNSTQAVSFSCPGEGSAGKAPKAYSLLFASLPVTPKGSPVPSDPAPTTDAPTTPAPTTDAPTTPAPTDAPTTPAPTTSAPVGDNTFENYVPDAPIDLSGLDNLDDFSDLPAVNASSSLGSVAPARTGASTSTLPATGTPVGLAAFALLGLLSVLRLGLARRDRRAA